MEISSYSHQFILYRISPNLIAFCIVFSSHFSKKKKSVFVYAVIGIIVAGTVFLLAQLAVIAIWTYLYQRRRKARSIDNCSSTYGPSLQTATLPGSRTDSLSKLYDYDHSMGSRHGHF